MIQLTVDVLWKHTSLILEERIYQYKRTRANDTIKQQTKNTTLSPIH